MSGRSWTQATSVVVGAFLVTLGVSVWGSLENKRSADASEKQLALAIAQAKQAAQPVDTATNPDDQAKRRAIVPSAEEPPVTAAWWFMPSLYLVGSTLSLGLVYWYFGVKVRRELLDAAEASAKSAHASTVDQINTVWKPKVKEREDETNAERAKVVALEGEKEALRKERDDATETCAKWESVATSIDEARVLLAKECERLEQAQVAPPALLIAIKRKIREYVADFDEVAKDASAPKRIGYSADTVENAAQFLHRVRFEELPRYINLVELIDDDLRACIDQRTDVGRAKPITTPEDDPRVRDYSEHLPTYLVRAALAWSTHLKATLAALDPSVVKVGFKGWDTDDPAPSWARELPPPPSS